MPIPASWSDEDRPGVVLGNALVRLRSDRDEHAMSAVLGHLCERGDGSALQIAMDKLEREGVGPNLRAWEIRLHVSAGLFAEAEVLVDAIEPALEDAELRSYCLYARGLAAYGSGDVARAVESWARASGDDPAALECAHLRDRAARLHDETASLPSDDGHAAVLDAIRRADALVSAGDAEGAIAVLDEAIVWTASEPQSLARLAELHLAREPRTAAEWLRVVRIKARREVGLLRPDGRVAASG